ncbi:MAG: glutathione S-transferase family protein [Pseudomonadota bacterium]|nr:glutathione S-transferase family protein [Pseudomonadota bacterium]
MKLYLNTASPFARLCRVLLVETGLEKDTELVMTDPWAKDEKLLGANPAGKIPALSLEDGTHLVESSCIADFLMLRSGAVWLSPLSHENPAERLEVLGLARAAIDCSFGAVIQERFAPGSPLIERWTSALPRIAERLGQLYGRRKRSPDCDLGDLTTAVAFDYVGFRLPQVDWRKKAGPLVECLAVLSARSSLASTKPK